MFLEDKVPRRLAVQDHRQTPLGNFIRLENGLKVYCNLFEYVLIQQTKL
jgi:hypothetical protein